MAFTPNGKHLVAGQWLDGNGTFTSSPAHGPAHAFAVGTVELVNRAAEAAEEAFLSYGYASRADRAAFLRAIADEIEARAEAITEIGTRKAPCPSPGCRASAAAPWASCASSPTISRRAISSIAASMRPCRTASPHRARKSA
nr:aldehyde dehydrogenase family protein [Roseateles sp. XES5]